MEGMLQVGGLPPLLEARTEGIDASRFRWVCGLGGQKVS